jgi:outer membrane protein TolC
MDMQNQVGMNFNVPIYRQKRHAAVCEASAKLRQRRAELEARIDQVRFEVESAWDRVSERRTVVRLYEQKILPAAEANVQSARINYTAGKVDFLRLVEAERQLREQQDKYHGTVAEYHRRMAQLQRAVGGGMRDEG